ncbi:hypothetical protein [Leclercia adecarboxylata]|nr:hypothetical protein [Leclercia adecarboxylata]
MTTKKSVTPEISITFCKAITGEYRDGGGWQEGGEKKKPPDLSTAYSLG